LLFLNYYPVLVLGVAGFKFILIMDDLPDGVPIHLGRTL